MPRLFALALASILAAQGAAPILAASAADRPTVCVMYFQNNTGDPAFDPLEKGLADMLVTDLASAPGLRVVERARLQEVLGELDLQRSEYVDPATAGRIGKLVGAANVVTGALAAMEPKIRIDIRMIEVETGAVLVADRIVGDMEAIARWQTILDTWPTTSEFEAVEQRIRDAMGE